MMLLSKYMYRKDKAMAMTKMSMEDEKKLALYKSWVSYVRYIVLEHVDIEALIIHSTNLLESSR